MLGVKRSKGVPKGENDSRKGGLFKEDPDNVRWTHLSCLILSHSVLIFQINSIRIGNYFYHIPSVRS